MKDTFNEEVYLALPLEAQLKVEQIYNIANILHVNRLPKLNSTEFDHLYDKPLKELEAITGYVRLRVNNIEGE
jgi:hypothetical protein